MVAPVLVVGGDGRLGRALVRRLRDGGDPVIATTRRPDPPAGCVRFDLCDASSWQPPVAPATVVLLAAVSGLAAEQADAAVAEQVNVQAPVLLARRAAAAGAFVVFVSTDQVFDGRRPRVPEFAPCCPATLYGRHKAQVEEACADLDGRCAILRLGKVLAHDLPLLASWREELRAGRTIEAFEDLRLAPVPLTSAVTVLELLTRGREPGIYHLTAEEDVTYAELAQALAATEGAAPDRVRRVAAHERRPSLHLPRHVALGGDHLLRSFGIRPPSARWTLGSVVAAPGGPTSSTSSG